MGLRKETFLLPLILLFPLLLFFLVVFALFVFLSLPLVQRQQVPAISRLGLNQPILIIAFPSSNNMTVFDRPLNDDQKPKTQRVAESQRILGSAFENEVDEVVDEKHPRDDGECRPDG